MNDTQRKPSPWIIGRRWYIAHTNPQCEWRAAINARQSGWTVFLPWYWHKRGGRCAARDTKRPLLTGYIFAAGDRFLSLYALKNPLYVNQLLGDRDGPYLIPDTDPVMRELLGRADETGMVEQAKQPLFTYGPGDEVEIGHGSPFEGQVGKIVSLTKRQALVWGNVFGGTLMKVPHAQIKRRAPELAIDAGIKFA